MADCYVNDTIFEIKAPEGKTINCIERNLRKAVNHQSPNIVLDSFRIKNIQDRSIQSFLLERLKRRHGIQRILFVNRKRKVIDINRLLG
ncbi:CdiA C-terminal domain-containing protein [Mediterraneibacter agrestimuris]|uniref:CdiA C-terminal domain-containing protein n=1 Tax=Mediterraneibacter agrestimuris TaxID=2941333 RepID=UPI0038CC1AF7